MNWLVGVRQFTTMNSKISVITKLNTLSSIIKKIDFSLNFVYNIYVR